MSSNLATWFSTPFHYRWLFDYDNRLNVCLFSWHQACSRLCSGEANQRLCEIFRKTNIILPLASVFTYLSFKYVYPLYYYYYKKQETRRAGRKKCQKEGERGKLERLNKRWKVESKDCLSGPGLALVLWYSFSYLSAYHITQICICDFSEH